MDDIKFKAKRKDNKEWVEGHNYFSIRRTFDKKDFYYIADENQSNFEAECDANKNILSIPKIKFANVLPETICRYIGIKDKTGKPIFEHDIVKTKYGRLCVVTWFSSPCYCGWDLNFLPCKDNHLFKAVDKYDLWLSNNLEVVGNIHDTPELSKEYIDLLDTIDWAYEYVLKGGE